MNKSYFFLLTVISILFFTSFSFGQIYSTDFENYTAGELLACQDSANWTTFSLTPCDSIEDAYISTNYANSGTKSLVILPGDDIIKLLGNLTSGKWHISFDVFFPTGKAGYFNILASFYPLPYEWGLEVYFDDGGIGNVNAGGTNAAFFAFSYDTWFPVEVIVNLALDLAELRVNNTSIHMWQWTLGATGGGCSLMLGAVNFYGAYPNNEMYVDNFWFGDFPVSVESEIIKPLGFSLEQNYPNPFNPVTTIRYQIPELSFVTLKVYDVLGNEIITLVNEEIAVGSYEVEFNAKGLTSGVYFYILKTGNYFQSRKMILLK
jgi:hypothetical protein